MNTYVEIDRFECHDTRGRFGHDYFPPEATDGGSRKKI